MSRENSLRVNLERAQEKAAQRKVFQAPRIFYLKRLFDETGVSGTGVVLEGIVFHNGKVAICWRSDMKPEGHSSITLFESMSDFESIHITPHPKNRSVLIWA